MPEKIILFAVLLNQVVLISWYAPRTILSGIKRVINEHPPAQYPRLYPVPMDMLNKRLYVFSSLNQVIFVLGLAIIFHAWYTGAEELLNWDTHTVIGLLGILQMSPVLLMGSWASVFLRIMRHANPNPTRTARLEPRRLLSFVSPVWLICAALAYIGYFTLVLYFVRHPFEGFGGYANIIVVSLVNLAYIALIARRLHGKKQDPYRAHEDRLRQTERVVKILIFTSVAMTFYLSISLINASMDQRHFNDILISAYLQLLVMISLRMFRPDDINFEVYREQELKT